MEKAQQLIEAMKAKERDLSEFSEFQHLQDTIPEETQSLYKRLSNLRFQPRLSSKRTTSIPTVRSNNGADTSNKERALEANVGDTDSSSEGEKKTENSVSGKTNESMKNILQLIASFQFALVIVITRERIPKAFGENGAPGEGAIVLSMLLLTSASGRIETVFGGEDGIKSVPDLLKFFCLSIPIFVYMLVCELWFMHLLFGFYDAEKHLQGLGDNKHLVLDITRVLSVIKITAVVTALIVVPLTKAYLVKRKQMQSS